MYKTAQRHLAAIHAARVAKANVIGIRKILNHAQRLRMGYSGNRCNASVADARALENALEACRPAVEGELHDSGAKVLRNPRYAKRFDDAQRAIIESPALTFQLVRFDYIGRDGMHAVPVYRAAANGRGFHFRNIPWQSAWIMGEEDGPRIVGGQI